MIDTGLYLAFVLASTVLILIPSKVPATWR
jgi:hypothetical protein